MARGRQCGSERGIRVDVRGVAPSPTRVAASPRHLARYQVTKDPRRPHDTGIDHIFARCGSQSAAADGGAAAAAAVGEARVYSDGKRCHLTDGVVFCQGGAPYVLGTDAACVARGSGWFHLPPVRVSDRAAARCGPAVPQRGIIV